MNKRDATELEYKLLHSGSEDGQFSLGFADFSERVMKLWFLGKDSGGAEGIIPAEPFSAAADAASLSFWLVKKTEKIKFECWLLDRLARTTHMKMFVNLYGEGAGEAEALAQETDSDGAEAEINVGITEPTIASAPVPAGPVQLPASHNSVVIRNKSKKKAKKKKAKGDMFDPFAGLLY